MTAVKSRSPVRPRSLRAASAPLPKIQLQQSPPFAPSRLRNAETHSSRSPSLPPETACPPVLPANEPPIPDAPRRIRHKLDTKAAPPDRPLERSSRLEPPHPPCPTLRDPARRAPADI